jgi:uncharacterized membrane protein YjdF
MSRLLKRLEWPFLAAFFIAGSAFLFKMAYLHVLVTTAWGLALVLIFWWYVRQRYGAQIPLILPCLIMLAVEADALGNYFHLYGRAFGPVQYDEFAHLLVQALVAPSIVWLLWKGITHFHYRLPLGLITFFAITIMFSFSGFYEILELWDDKSHPMPGLRIHGPYDAPNDLQWDLAGTIIGALLTYAVFKVRARSAQNAAVTAQGQVR